MKKTLVIQAHPNKNSYVAALAEKYSEGARNTGHEVRLIHLIDLEFDPILRASVSTEQKLEDDLIKMQDHIKWSDHIVLTYPNWWGTYPALLKGFIDRTFIPDFAFKYENGKKLPKKLLKGRSARIIMTMDTPKWYYSLVYKASGINSLKKSLFGFIGVSPVSTTILTAIHSFSKDQLTQGLKEVYNLKGQ